MNRLIIISVAVVCLFSAGSIVGKTGKQADDYHFDRQRMVSKQIANRGIKDRAVLSAMRNVPRHELVPTNLIPNAYEDRPLPIGHGQTISQPYIVGLMTELLDLEPEDRVLEIGTGSGYQAAILSQIVEQVVKVVYADGYYGHEDSAPYDAIIVTAAAEHIPPPLLKQLKPGGKMVIPVGRSGWTQNLLLVEKDEAGHTKTRSMLPVRFVPFTRTKR
jgi:protein-L-isoaspartate(D-aspartate) O-methyltransferase